MLSPRLSRPRAGVAFEMGKIARSSGPVARGFWIADSSSVSDRLAIVRVWPSSPVVSREPAVRFREGVVLILATNTCGDARLSLCRMTGLTSFVADLPAHVGSLRSQGDLRVVRGSRPPFGHQKFVLLGRGPHDWSWEVGVLVVSWSSFPSSRRSTDAVMTGVIMVDDFSSEAFARNELLARRLVGCASLGSTAPVGDISV